jgi:hypothetical protein
MDTITQDHWDFLQTGFQSNHASYVRQRAQLLARIERLDAAINANVRGHTTLIQLRRTHPSMIHTNSRVQELLIQQGRIRPTTPKQKIRKIVLKKHTIQQAKETNTECPICYDTYELQDVVTLGCSHRFCQSCIVSHMKASVSISKDLNCPICRSDIKHFEVNYTTRTGNKCQVMKQSAYIALTPFCI